MKRKRGTKATRDKKLLEAQFAAMIAYERGEWERFSKEETIREKKKQDKADAAREKEERGKDIEGRIIKPNQLERSVGQKAR
jgi:hypothetical protein